MVQHRRGRVVDRQLSPVARDQQRVIGECDDAPLVQRAQGGVFDRRPRRFVDDLKDIGQRPAHRLGLGPTGQTLGDGVQEDHATFGVGADHGVADAGQRDPQPLAFRKQLLLGALPLDQNAGRVLQRYRTQRTLFVFHWFRHRASPSDASAVPSTRARILAKATSRLVESSSQNGAKPQSSVVPSISTGM